MKDFRSFLILNKYYYLTVLLYVIFGGFLLLSTTKDVVTLWVNKNYDPILDTIILVTNQMGEAWFSATVLIVIWVMKGWRYAVLALICFLLSLGVTMFTKHILFPGELRPVPYFELREETLRLIEGVVQLQTESFPSGHTSASFSVFTVIAVILPKKRWHWIFAFLALIVAYSRLYLSQHFITDVYAGMIIGVTVSSLSYFLIRKLTNLIPPDK
jgi:membrane-associated phospholipid phosphatase